MTESILQHRSLREMISEDLRGRILSKELQPGVRLDVPAIAGAYGVSPGSVREAAIILESEGLVVVSPRRGISVRAITTSDLIEIYAVREVIDLAAAEQVASLGDEVIARLQVAQDRIDEAWGQGGFNLGLAADLDFHVCLARLTGNSRLEGIAVNLADQTRFHLQPVEEVDARIRERPPGDLHLAIVDAIVMGDRHRIREAVLAHYAFSRGRIAQE
jgi:DNA-binding GntR family transcriptional regulator